jgi:D-3-phosphoglycerate dehydrogenase
MMRKGVYLVNTSRASLLDETAVLSALEQGHIAGLAMDVYHEEPPKDYHLIKHDRVIATPHVGGFTRQSILRATRGAVDNLLKYL